MFCQLLLSHLVVMTPRSHGYLNKGLPVTHGSQVSCGLLHLGLQVREHPVWDILLWHTGKRSNDTAGPDTSCSFLEVTNVISTHDPLAKERNLATPDLSKAGRQPVLGKGRQGQAWAEGAVGV